MAKEAVILELKIDSGAAFQKMGELRLRIDEVKKAEKQLKHELEQARRQHEQAAKGAEIAEKAYKRGQATIEEVTKAQQEAKAAAEEYSKKQKETAEALSATKVASDTYKRELREVEKAVKNDILQGREQIGSLKSLRAELANLTASYDALSREEREAAQGQELKRKINETTNALKEAEEATQRYYRNVGNYTQASQEVIAAVSGWAGVNQGIGNSILSMVTDMNEGGVSIRNFGDIWQGLKGKLQSFGTTAATLAANPYFLAIIGVTAAVGAAKWWFSYNEGLREATRLTQEFTGLQGNEMRAYRDEVQAVADTFGKDFKEVLQGADALVANYGISAEEALRIVKDGFVAGADISGNYLQKLQQYPGAFRDAGISASEFAGYLVQTKSGIFSDKGLELISQAGGKIRAMKGEVASAFDAIGLSSAKISRDLESGAKTTQDVLKDLNTRLKELPEGSREAGRVITAVFGEQAAKAGRGLVQSLTEVDTNLQSLKASTGELGALTEKEFEAKARLNNALSTLFDQTGGAFEEMTTTAKVFAFDALSSVIDGVVDTYNWFVKLYNESAAFRVIIAGLKNSFVTTFRTAGNLFSSLIAYIKAGGEVLAGALTLDIDRMQQGYQQAGAAWAKFLKGQVAITKKGVSEMQESLNSRAVAIERKSKSTPSAGGAKASSIGAGGRGLSTSSTPSAGAGRRSSAAPRTADTSNRERDQIQQEIKTAQDKLAAAREYTQAWYDLKREIIRKNEAAELQDLNKSEAQKEAIRGKYAAEQRKLEEERAAHAYEQNVKHYQIIAEGAIKGTREEYEAKRAVIAAEREKELALHKISDAAFAQLSKSEQEKHRAEIVAIVAKYKQQERTLEEEANTAALQILSQRFATEKLTRELNGATTIEQKRLEAEQAQALFEQVKQREAETDEAFNLRKLEAQKAFNDKKNELAAAELAIEQGKAEAAAQIFGTLSEGLQKVTNENTAAAKLAKVLAIAESMINMGLGISRGIASASAIPFPANLPAIATITAKVVGGVTAAIGTIKSAKFARGGLVRGAGTGTSDSISARLSNGESVINAKSTAAFAPLLSAINVAGGGVPIAGAGGAGFAIDTRAIVEGVTQAILNAPPPVVSVEEIDRVQKRVQVIEEKNTL